MRGGPRYSCLPKFREPPPIGKKQTSKSQVKNPWDSVSDRTPIQNYIRDEHQTLYLEKHKKLADTDEANFLNTFELHCCKWYGSENIISRGKKYSWRSEVLQ